MRIYSHINASILCGVIFVISNCIMCLMKGPLPEPEPAKGPNYVKHFSLKDKHGVLRYS